MSTIGHIKDLPTKELGITIEWCYYILIMSLLKTKKKSIADICKEAQTADEIYLAPDPDREGEIIAWHIAKKLKKCSKKSKDSSNHL